VRYITFFILFLLILLATLQVVAFAAAELVSVYIEPTSIELKPEEEFKVRIKVDPKGKGISAGEINVTFNIDAFECINISPGDILGPSPLEGVKRIDNAAGFLRYAIARIGRTEPPTSPGVFAEIRFKVKSKVNIGTYNIELVGVGLADEGFKDITNISIGNRLVAVKITEMPPQTTTIQTVTRNGKTQETKPTPTITTAPTTTITETTTTPYTSIYTISSPLYTYPPTVIVQTTSTIYLALAIILIVSLTAIVGVLATLYLRRGRRRKPRVLSVRQ
jgi:hypothetical protein